MNYLNELDNIINNETQSNYDIAKSIAHYYRTVPRNIIKNDLNLLEAINKWHVFHTDYDMEHSIQLIITYCNVLHFRVTGDYEQLFRWGLKHLTEDFSKEDWLYLGWIHRLISAASFTVGLIDQSVEHALKAVDLFTHLDDLSEINRSYIQLGISYDYTDNYKLQLEYFQKAYDLSTTPDTRKIAINNIAFVHILRKDYASAKTNLYKLKDMVSADENTLVNVGLHLNLLRIALHDREIAKAQSLIEIIADFPLLETDQTLTMDFYLLQAKAHTLTNENNKAKSLLQTGYNQAKVINSKKYLLFYLESFAKTYLKEEDYKTAFSYQEAYINLTREIEHEKAGYKYLFLRIQYEIEQMNKEVNQLKDQLNETKETTIYTLATLAEYKDQITGKHILRTIAYVEGFCNLINKEMTLDKQLSQEYIDNFSRSSSLHDIGKVGISDEILKKPAKLSSEEFELMKKHTLLGRDALSITKKILGRTSFLKLAQTIAYSHHEKWDGSGYPEGLSGKDIPFEGRVVALIDVYDALISRRPYKKPFSHLEAIEIIKEGRATHFDPDLTDIFVENHMVFYRIAMRLIDSEEEKEVIQIGMKD